MAHGFARHGATVVVASRKLEPCVEVGRGDGRAVGRVDHQHQQHRRRAAVACRGAVRGGQGGAQQPHGRHRPQPRSVGPVNAITPGPFLTDLSEAWDMDSFERTAAAEIPAGRGGNPDEIVGAALYLASAASSYTNGAVLKIDGGWAHAPA
jgi:NAD(P)-dependent dehydrogenase (short-subunit alcohol dehydrogenase family)